MPALQHAPELAAEVSKRKIGNRTDSAALLAWFLEEVWRLDPEEVSETICDGSGDKGIDALWVDNESNEIVVFQSSHKQDPTKSTQGDQKLREFVGVAPYFASPESLAGLLESKPNPELRWLLARQSVAELVASGSYTTRLVFVTNADLDRAGLDYARVHERPSTGPEVVVFAGSKLGSIAAHRGKPRLLGDAVSFRAVQRPMEQSLTSTESIVVALVSAKELVRLPGIEDQSLFSRNVRLSLGKTRINNELRATVERPSEHLLFPAFHNGLTLLTHGVEVRGRRVQMRGVAVVNGCQSLTTLYALRESITDGMNLLVKVVVVPEESVVADQITYRSNNQNAVSFRDQRSNDPTLRNLQAEVGAEFNGAYFFRIKDGEEPPAGSVVLDNTESAQQIMAVYRSEPWAAVRKIRLFDADFQALFDRRLTASRLVLLHMIDCAALSARQTLRANVQASFASIRFTLQHMIATLLRGTELGRQLLEDPTRWVAGPSSREESQAALNEIAVEVAKSMNYYLESKDDDIDFDPKAAFKSRAGVQEVTDMAARDADRFRHRGISVYFEVAPPRSPN